MNVITKFSALGLAAVLFAACSDNSGDNGDGNLTPEITGIGLSTTGGSTVTNYKTNGAAKALRRAVSVTMPTETTAPSNAEDIKNVSGDVVDKDIVVKSNYTVPAGVTFTKCRIYVSAGTLTIGNTGSSNTIVVNHGASLYHTGDAKINSTIYNYGEFKQENGKALVIGDEGKFYTSQNLSLAKEGQSSAIKVENGTLYVGKTLRCTDLNINQSGIVVATDIDMEAHNVTSLGHIQLAGHLIANNITLSNSSETEVSKYVIVKSSLTMNENAKMNTNSLDASSKKDEAGNLLGNIVTKMSNSSSLTVNQAGYLTFDTFDGKESAKVSVNGTNSVAVFKARKFSYDNEDVKLFSTASNGATFLLELTDMTLNGKAVDFDDAIIDASYYDYAKAQKYDGIEEAKFTEDGYKMNTTQFEALPKLDLITTVENANPDYMSATCIAPFNNHLYVAYHTRGTQHGANIEVFDVNNNQVSLIQSLKDNDDALDFNHCMVADNRLYLSGSHVNAGAGFGYISIAGDGKLNTQATTINGKTREPLQFVTVLEKLNARTNVDANSAVKYNNGIVLATTAGYSYFTEGADGWTRGETTTTAGKAKSVIVNNGKLWGLNFASATNDDTTPVNGTLAWTTNNTLTGASTANVGQIAPTNGKNTIFADATGNVYVCRGQFGLQQVLANGTMGWNWEIAKNKDGNVKGYANGVAADDQYVYVACGGYGLVVLDKATGKELCRRAVGASANYVAVSNGYIFVANGQNRVQMFKLNYTKK